MKNNDVQGEVKITKEHVKNNKEMRTVLAKNNIIPENLPPEEDIQKLQRRVKADENKKVDHSKKNNLLL